MVGGECRKERRKGKSRRHRRNKHSKRSKSRRQSGGGGLMDHIPTNDFNATDPSRTGADSRQLSWIGGKRAHTRRRMRGGSGVYWNLYRDFIQTPVGGFGSLLGMESAVKSI